MHKFKIINNKVKVVFRVFSIIMCLGLIYFNTPNLQKIVFANTGEDIDTKIDLNNDGKVEIVKFHKGILKVSSTDGKVIFEKDEGEDVYSSIAFIKDKKINDTKVLFQSKTKNTSGSLAYTIYKLDGGEIKEVVHKEDIYKGIISISDSGEIIEEIPSYVENDSNAVPSYTVKNHFVLQDDKLVLVKTEKLGYTPNDNLSENPSLNATVYHKNPSYAEIEKILENVANEKGIPVAIFKAIAWQESRGTDYDNGKIANWRQFVNGEVLMGYDKVGIGLMQVSDYVRTNPTPTDVAYINRLKYDLEFNIREGAKILLDKWALQTYDGASYKIPRVGDASPNYLANWYYTIWAYNGYSSRNNPIAHTVDPIKFPYLPYQTIVIGHVNNVFNKSMIDLYEYNRNLFPVVELPIQLSKNLPRADIAEISGKHSGDLKIKEKNYNYITTTNLTIRDANMVGTSTYFMKNDVVTIKGSPVIKDGYVTYYVEGASKSGYVRGNWLKPVGDINCDGQVDIYDFVKQSKNINGQGTIINDINRISIESSDVNMDGVVDIKDIALTATNYNFSLYKINISN